MKSKISLMIFLFAMCLAACKKEMAVLTPQNSGTSLDPSGRPGTPTNNAGIQIDGNGGFANTGNTGNSGMCIDPIGKPRPCPKDNYGIAIDPNGYGIAIDPDGYGIAIDPNGKPVRRN